MTIERMARAIMAVHDHIDTPASEQEREAALVVIRNALEANSPTVMPMVDLIQKVADILLDGPLEAHARELVRLLSVEGKQAVFTMTVDADHPGAGEWEVVVRRAEKKPAKKSTIILPEGFQLQ